MGMIFLKMKCSICGGAPFAKLGWITLCSGCLVRAFNRDTEYYGTIYDEIVERHFKHPDRSEPQESRSAAEFLRKRFNIS